MENRNQNPVENLTRFRAILILLAGALGISFSPVIVKLLGSDTLGATAIGFWRTFIGSVTLFSIIMLRKERVRMPMVPMLWCIFTGLCFALDLSIWHRSILYIGAGMSTVIANTHVFATATVSHFVFKERLSLRFLVAAPVAVFGLALLVGVFSESVVFTSLYIKGVVFCIMCAFLYALYMVGLKKVTIHASKPDPAVIMAWICLWCAVFTLIGTAFESEAFLPPDFYSLGLLLLLGIFGQAVAWWGIALAMKKIAIHHASLILLLQPVLAMVWGTLFLDELFGSEQIIGAVITLSAIYAGSVLKPHRRNNE